MGHESKINFDSSIHLPFWGQRPRLVNGLPSDTASRAISVSKKKQPKSAQPASSEKVVICFKVTPQFKAMIQKLLAERFGLTFRREKRELSAYVITCRTTAPRKGARLEVRFQGGVDLPPGIRAGLRIVVLRAVCAGEAVPGSRVRHQLVRHFGLGEPLLGRFAVSSPAP